MTDHTDFETRLADAMRRYADRAPTDVDATALAREIASGTAKVRQQPSHWWPFGRIDHQPGRSRTMFMATGTGIVAIAGLALALSVGSLLPTGDTAPPGAESPVIGDDWAFFTGELRLDGDSLTDAAAETIVENGMLAQLGSGFTNQTMTSDDPRFSGTRTERHNTIATDVTWDRSVSASLLDIEGADGSWTCLTSMILHDDIESGESGWCTGNEAYAGLDAYIHFEYPLDADVFDTVPFIGYVTDGGVLEPPEPPAE